MSNLFQAVVGFFAPRTSTFIKPVLIEAINDCGEKRYIEIEWDETMYSRIVNLTDKVRLSMYKNDDILPLFKEYESVENFFKGSSKSQMNLSSLDSV
jgi:hypothetical protein